MFIDEICDGSVVEGYYLIKTLSNGKTKTGNDFMRLTFADMTGEINAVWFRPDGFITGADIGKPVKVIGEAKEFNGKVQITVSNLRLALSTDPFSMEDLIPTAPVDLDSTMDYVKSILESIEDDDYRNYCLENFKEHFGKWKNTPGAKSMHHAFIGGLLMHTADMLEIAQVYYEIYSSRININRSLLIAGTFLHDFGKIDGYEYSETGLVSDYSLKGNLVGHLVMGAMEVHSSSLPEDKKLLLEHMLLAHHGKRELGAAVEPRTIEALILSFIDNCDARIEMYREAAENVESGKYTERIAGMDGIAFYVS